MRRNGSAPDSLNRNKDAAAIATHLESANSMAASAAATTVKLNTGFDMPLLGLG